MLPLSHANSVASFLLPPIARAAENPPSAESNSRFRRSSVATLPHAGMGVISNALINPIGQFQVGVTFEWLF